MSRILAAILIDLSKTYPPRRPACFLREDHHRTHKSDKSRIATFKTSMCTSFYGLISMISSAMGNVHRKGDGEQMTDTRPRAEQKAREKHTGSARQQAKEALREEISTFNGAGVKKIASAAESRAGDDNRRLRVVATAAFQRTTWTRRFPLNCRRTSTSGRSRPIPSGSTAAPMRTTGSPEPIRSTDPPSA